MKCNLRPAYAACCLLTLLALITACSNLSSPYRIVSQMNLPATPEFVRQITVGRHGTRSDSMCIEISPATFVEPDHWEDDLTEHLARNTRILVDEEVVAQDSLQVFYHTTAALAINDPGTPTYSGITFCFDLGHLAPGVHTTSIDASTLSGAPFTYSWTFEIVASSKPSGDGILPTLAQLPTLTLPANVRNGLNDRQFHLTLVPDSDYFGSIRIYTGQMFFDEVMCISLNEKALWEAGDTAETLDTHFKANENFALSVDDQLLAVEDGNIFTESVLSYVWVFDDMGAVIGSYSDLAYCFNTEELTFGDHEAQIVVRTTSGKEYSYTWNFSIVRTR